MKNKNNGANASSQTVSAVNSVTNTRAVSITKKWKLKDLKGVLKTIDIDKTFQSPIRWDTEMQRKYIESILRGMAVSKYVFADVDECEKSANALKDKNYFLSWGQKETKYLNIDSNNRIHAWKLLFDNVLQLKKGVFYSVEGGKFEIAREQLWKDLSEEVRQFILDTVEITVELYIKATREQLSYIFLSLNDGKSLNAAEKRNAYISEIAIVCRDLGEKYYVTNKSWILTGFINGQKVWNNVPFNDNKYNRRHVDSQLAGMALYDTYGFGQSLTDSKLNTEYEDTSTMNKNAKNLEKRVDKFFIWNEKFKLRFKKLKHLSQGTSFDLFVLYSKYGTQIPDMDKFVDAFVRLNNELGDIDEATYRIGDKKHNYKSLLRGRETNKCKIRYEILSNGLKKELGLIGDSKSNRASKTNPRHNNSVGVILVAE